MVAEAAGRTRFQSLILCSCSALSVQMLPQIVVRGLQLLYYVRCSSTASPALELNLGLVHVIDVVLVLVVLHRLLPVVLVLEDFCQYTLCARGNARMIDGAVSAVALDAHSTAVNCIELIFDVTSCSGRPWATCRAWIAASLRN